MAYSAAEGRAQILESLEEAAADLALAIASLTEAYEHVDEHAGDQLEEALFRPVQAAYSRLRRTHSEFAARSGLPAGEVEQAPTRLPSTGARELLDGALEAAQRADLLLGELQDTMLPVEVGDPELRAGITEVRARIGELGPRTRELERTLGR